jgi:hypothetical protein
MSRLDKDREARLQPKRMQFAIDELLKLDTLDSGIEKVNETQIRFIYKGERVTYYPYSGWAVGKSIKDGRGIDNLLNQLKSV